MVCGIEVRRVLQIMILMAILVVCLRRRFCFCAASKAFVPWAYDLYVASEVSVGCN
jgi:hypothetical protein